MTTRLDSYIKAMGKAYKKRPKPLVIYKDDTSITLELMETGELLVSERALNTDDPEEYGFFIPYTELKKVAEWIYKNTQYGRQ